MTDQTTGRCANANCGHLGIDHEALSPQCSAARCTCLKYRPSAQVAAPVPPMRLVPSGVLPAPTPVAPPRPALDDLLRACARSEYKRTRAMGIKLADLAEKVVTALRTERESAEAKAKQSEEFAAKRAEVDKLAKQLAAAKAALRGTKPTPERATPTSADHVCAECGAAFTTSQGRSLHARRTHAPASEAL